MPQFEAFALVKIRQPPRPLDRFVIGFSLKESCGIKTAAKTVRNLEWFEVTQIKGHIVDGAVGHYQVSLKLGFRYEPK